MKIGVIGVGEMGGTLALRWCERGHEVRLANSRGPETVKALAREMGAVAAGIQDAVAGADVVVLSMPFPAAASLPKDLFHNAAESLVIVDTANYYPDVRDPRIPAIDAGTVESVWVSRQLGRPIFKAFNSIMFYALKELGTAEGTPGRLAIPVAGDDPDGKKIVMGLVNEAGFDPVDGGTLVDSWRQQPSTPAYCCDYDADKVREGVRMAIKGKAETIRDTVWRERYGRLFADKPAYCDVHTDVVALNRSLNPF